MNKNERDSIKRLITERFVTALDYLVDSGKIDNIKDFERITGIRSQRITGMRRFLKEEDVNDKPYYTNADHIFIINDLFGVSFDYIFKGKKPIVVGLSYEKNVAEPMEDYHISKISLLEESMSVIRQNLNLLSEKLQYHIDSTT